MISCVLKVSFHFYHGPRSIFYLKFTSQFRTENGTRKLFFKPRILFPKRENKRTNEHDNTNNNALCDFYNQAVYCNCFCGWFEIFE